MMDIEKQSKPARRHLVAFAILAAATFGFCGFAYALLSPFGRLAGNERGLTPLTPILKQVDSSSRIVNFKEHDQFKSLNHVFDDFWDDFLLPYNGGYVASSTTRNNTDKVGIAMFHQLHCLAMIRGEMQLLKDALDSAKAGDGGKGEHAEKVQVHRRHGHMHGDDDVPPGEHEHALHCFDYIRQTLMCHADGTIEKPKVDDKGKPYINGGGERKCRDWEPLYKASTDSDKKPFFTDDL